MPYFSTKKWRLCVHLYTSSPFSLGPFPPKVFVLHSLLRALLQSVIFTPRKSLPLTCLDETLLTSQIIICSGDLCKPSLKSAFNYLSIMTDYFGGGYSARLYECHCSSNFCCNKTVMTLIYSGVLSFRCIYFK